MIEKPRNKAKRRETERKEESRGGQASDRVAATGTREETHAGGPKQASKQEPQQATEEGEEEEEDEEKTEMKDQERETEERGWSPNNGGTQRRRNWGSLIDEVDGVQGRSRRSQRIY